MGRPSVMHVERMLMEGARTISFVAVRDGDSGGIDGGGIAVDVRTV